MNKGLGNLLTSYLFSRKRLGLWLLFVILLGAYAVNVKFAVAMNEWNGRFFNALQQIDKEAIYAELFHFIGLASSIILLLVTADYLKKRLILALRRDITHIFFNRWLSPNSAHYLLRESGHEPDNPDQRITEDVRALVSLTVNLTFSFFDSVLTISSFSVILWELSGAVSFFGYEIPGYMFWVCIVYTLISTGITHLIGRRLKVLNIESQHQEANLRAALMEKRRHADAIAGAGGEEAEASQLRSRFKSVLDILIALIKKQRDLDYFTVGLGQVTHLAPIFFSLPSFLAGTIQMGGLMQIRGAFVDVARSLSWFIFAYDDLARLAATYERLRVLEAGLAEADRTRDENRARIERLERGLSTDVVLHVPTHDGSTLTLDAAFSLNAGTFTIVTGESGIGKTTLLKALAGFFSDYSGRIAGADDIFWLPQRTYTMKGSLRANLAYPQTPETLTDSEARELLAAVRLEGLVNSLDTVCDWSVKLSGGEQQRLTLIRAIRRQPAVLLMDEPTSAIDDCLAEEILQKMLGLLPKTAVVMISHQSPLFSIADRVVTLTRQPS